jgi:DNA-binding MarR family transcriptional regulator
MSPRPDTAPARPPLDPVDALAQLSFVIMGLLERRAAEHDLSIAATRLLGVLRDREPTMNDLARLLDLDKSSVTGLVDRAERRGLVERAPSPADRRAVLVRLTDEGRSLVSAAATQFGADVTAMLGRLSPRDRAGLSRLVSRLLVAHAAEHGIDLFATAAPPRGLAACEEVEVRLRPCRRRRPRSAWKFRPLQPHLGCRRCRRRRTCLRWTPSDDQMVAA